MIKPLLRSLFFSILSLSIFAVTVHEGVPYKMGRLEISGLDSNSLAKLRQIWRLAQRVIHDADKPFHISCQF